MENFISGIYGFLANILIFITEFPREMTQHMGGFAPLVVGSCFAIASILCVMSAIKKNGAQYNFFVKAAVGGAILFIVTHYAVLYLEELDVIETVPFYGSIGVFLLFVGGIAFVAVNYYLEKTKGTITLLVWGSEFLFAAGAIVLWSCMKGSDGTLQHENLMLIANIVNPFTTFVNELGFQTIIGIIEYILLMFLMFITVFLLHRMRVCLDQEWIVCVIGQFMAGAAYLIYEVHEAVPWRLDQAFLVFLLFCAGWMLNIVMFFYELGLRSQDGCIGAFFIAVSGVTWSSAIVIAVDIAKQGALSNVLGWLSGLMTKLYNIIPVGIHTNFNRGNWILAILGVCIAVVLAALIVILLFLILGKAFDYEADGIGMGVRWFRNCSMFFVISIVLYWSCSMYGAAVLSKYPWIDLAAQSLTGIGLALCFSNIAPAFNRGFMGQLKLILVSTLTSVLLGCLLVPAILALI